MHDFEFSLFVSVCDLLKSFRVMKNTKASKDFGATNGAGNPPFENSSLREN